MSNLEAMNIDDLCVNTIRTLSMDAVQKANSGHPGAPMALAPLAYVLWTRIMHYNPANPDWFNRDRFILSNGHASMLQYAMLYLTGYDISLEDIKNFRQWGSKTPGHPERGVTPGVETTTGPLGQGLMTAVGMAIAEAHQAAVYNRPGHEVIDHYTYVLCGDGDLMEGASHEAASLAGHLGLGKLICIYDDNHISIEGDTKLAYSDDVAKRFEAYHWHVQNLGEKANDLEALTKAIRQAQQDKEKPSIIIVRTHIAYGAPHLQDTSEAHGAPLGAEEIKLTKRSYGWPEEESFLIPDLALQHTRAVCQKGSEMESHWNKKYAAYKQAFPDLAKQFEDACNGVLADGWDSDIPVWQPTDGAIASRVASGKVINALAAKVPYLIGGSGDLSPSTNTLIKSSKYLARGVYENRNIAHGVREFNMAAVSSGLALHGGIRPFAATFFVFTDYARAAIRLASLMHLPVIYVMTHDSIGLGEDGATHIPIEHLASLRAMPNLCVIRPADANETAYAWRAAMMRRNSPTMLVLTRQGLPIFDRSVLAPAEGLYQGAYVLSKEKGNAPDIILIASGSEVQLILAAQSKLAEEGVNARVVSMPSWELFEEQPQSYREQVLPKSVGKRLAVEAGATFGWHKWVGSEGDILGIDKFGASAPGKENFKQFGFTVENVLAKAKKLLD